MKRRRSGNDQDSLDRARTLAERADSLTSQAIRVTSGVYQFDADGNPTLVGSALLVRLGTVRFLVTARHVLDLRSSGALRVGVSPEILSLGGEVTALRSTDAESDGDDNIDIGIVRVAGAGWDALADEAFASWDDLDINPPIASAHTFALVGFPVSLNRRQPIEGRLTSAAYRMAGLEWTEEVYRAAVRNPEVNVAVGFNRREMWGADGIRNSPDLYGASGSGLWRFGRRLRESTTAAKLSAVAIEWHQRGKHKYILGTRIHLVLALLSEKYPDVREYIAARMAAA